MSSPSVFFIWRSMEITTPESQKWYDERPTLVKRAIDAFPSGPCYRLKDTKGHYALHSFTEDLLTGKVSVKMIHMKDSWGYDKETDTHILVFGLDPATVISCDCKNNS